MALNTPKDVLSLIEKEDVKIVDLRFMDFPGLWQHFSIPATELEEDAFTTSGDLYISYRCWAQEMGESLQSRRSLGKWLATLDGVTSQKTSQGRGWRGLRLLK